jgi:ribosomal protein S18 acetylase RimI-like enzyme
LIRDAGPDDAAAVAALLGELGYPTGPEQAAVRLERLFEDPAAHAFVAAPGGDVVGLATSRIEYLIELDEPVCRLTSLVVAERARRAGVGRALVAAVEADAAAHGCGAIILTTAIRREGAHAFYERLGYAWTGRRFTKRLS